MEIDALTRRKLKLGRKFTLIKDIIMILVACLFILVAFVYALDKSNSISDSLANVRFGLFAFALIIAGTALIITVYVSQRDKKLPNIKKLKADYLKKPLPIKKKSNP